jgi:hypothetical protein
VTLITDTITLWVGASGVPERFVWQGTRYRVTDTPTPLEFDLNAITHLITVPTGWRFQGTTDIGESRIFDVLSVDHGQGWRVLRTYE